MELTVKAKTKTVLAVSNPPTVPGYEWVLEEATKTGRDDRDKIVQVPAVKISLVPRGEGFVTSQVVGLGHIHSEKSLTDYMWVVYKKWWKEQFARNLREFDEVYVTDRELSGNVYLTGDLYSGGL